MAIYDYPNYPATTGDSNTVMARPQNAIKRLATAVSSMGGWLWSGYVEYTRSTVHYDEHGVAHSTMLWF